MSAFAMFFVAIGLAIFQISKINGVKDFDIDNVLGQIHQDDSSPRLTTLDRSLERQENTDDDYEQLVENIVRSPQVQIGFPYKEKYYLVSGKGHRNKRDRFRKWPWRQYIYVKPAWLKSVYTPRTQNPLNNMKHEEDHSDLGVYSKIYLVLDPNADITDSDVEDLSNMVTSVLTKPSTSRKTSLKERFQKKRRYKGYVLKDNRRRIRDSKEMFAEKDSIERGYRSKRPRGDYGGVGGRTPIPYIRHRDDIFEKE
ncbi:uncharacterized protein LOC120632769 [Pararge aegeria]|uniref:uncharacterized protein LOC120632769 n=1 Tax=Pararge aegeria TaxID=116150 RepID=UPI0019CF659C|nr:uncharacterized protein LOC120632769 [Pararge aegeria]